jgi:hypothetical protein
MGNMNEIFRSKIRLMVFLIGTPLFSPQLAWAQNKVGNGGYVVHCEATNNRTTILLDFYESEQPLIDGLSQNHVEILEGRLSLLTQFDKKLGGIFKKNWSEMQKQIHFVENADLTESKDTNHLFQPKNKGCSLRQVAMRRRVKLPFRSNFIIDKEVWSELNELNKAGLLAHELIYEHFWKLGENDSTKARVFTAFVFSKDFENQNKDGFWRVIKGLKIPIYRTF